MAGVASVVRVSWGDRVCSLGMLPSMTARELDLILRAVFPEIVSAEILGLQGPGGLVSLLDATLHPWLLSQTGAGILVDGTL
jgi:hypothetical protein